MSHDPLDNPDTVVEILQRSIEERDWQGVDAAIRRLAAIDPRRCVEVVDAIKAAITVNRIMRGPINAHR